MSGMLGILLGSALRSLLLGTLVFAGLKLARLRDPRAETAIWIVILAAALAMPLLSAFAPAELAIRMPAIAWLQPAGGHAGPEAAAAAAAPHALIGRFLAPAILGLYGLVALTCLFRLMLGLILTARLYRAASRVDAPWARGRKIRASALVDGPLSFADCILLPADCLQWPPAKLAAVLVHEETHIQRGDFFIQLLASIHRAVFWFSPFAWWLQLRLGELAETASDAAAVRIVADPAAYAEILLDVTRRARRVPNMTAVAMAHGPGVAKRVDQILAGIPEKTLGAFGRITAVAGALVLSLGVAQVHAAAAKTAKAASQPPSAVRTADASAAGAAPEAVVHRRAAAGHGSAAKAHVQPAVALAAPSTTPVEEEISYDPRALLREPQFVRGSGLIVPGASFDN